MTEVLEQWAKEEACKRVNARMGSVAYWRPETVEKYTFMTELAWTIQKYEQPPVDPDLLIAREAGARQCEKMGWIRGALEYRGGDCDDSLRRGAAYLALKIAREQGAI